MSSCCAETSGQDTPIRLEETDGYICTTVELPHGPRIVDDVVHRRDTAMSQANSFRATELALEAQQQAT